MLGPVIGELFGTFILILLGDGVVANVGLAPRVASSGYSWDTITLGWAFAVIVAVYVSAGVSGAHINPAVTLALALRRKFAWRLVIPYWIAQVVGAFLGAGAVYLIYRDGLISAGMPNVWSTSPGSIFNTAFFGAVSTASSVGAYSYTTAFIAEFFGTAVLMWGILAAGDTRNAGLVNNLGPLLVGGTVFAIGLSLGGTSGYAINPARDFGPRVLGALVGTPNLFSTGYWWIPIVAPLVGGAVGIYAYDLFVTAFLPAREIQAETPAGEEPAYVEKPQM